MLKSIILALFAILSLLFTTACSNSEEKLIRDIAKAAQLEQEGKLEDSITLLQSLNERYPGNADILEPLAFAYSKAGRYDFAAFAFAEVAHFGNDNTLFYLQAAEHALLAGDEESAIRYYQSFLQHNQQDAHVWEELGKLQQSRNFYQDALESFMQKYKIEPTGKTAMEIAQAFLALDNLSQAESWFRSAREEDATLEKEALIGLVETAYAGNRLNRLEGYIEELKEKHPEALKNPNIQEIAEQLASFQKERETLNQMLHEESAEKPVEATTHENGSPEESMVELQNEEERKEAEPALQKPEEVLVAEAEQAEPEVSTEEKERTEIALSEIPEGRAKEDIPDALVEEAAVGMPEEQDTPVAEMHEEMPNESDIVEVEEEPTILKEARAAYRERDYSKANDLYWRYLSENPEDPEVWKELSNSFLNTQEFRAARAAALEATRRDPQNLVYAFQYLRVVQKTESPEQFLRELHHVRRRFPQSPDVSLILARTYDQWIEDPANSRYYYQEFLRLSRPEHPSRNEANEALGLPLEEAGDTPSGITSDSSDDGQ